MISFFGLKEKINRLIPQFPAKIFTKPFITVSREPGSGGSPIAKAVAKKLNFKLVDDQIIDQIAKSTKKRKEIIASIDEKSRSAIADMVHATLNPEYVSGVKYKHELAKAILTYACKGNCVIIGRGAHLITPFTKGLHVNIISSYKNRVKMAMKFEGHDEEKAKKIIKEVEKERDDFIKKFFGRTLKKRTDFDLIINTDVLDLRGARDIVATAFRAKFPKWQIGDFVKQQSKVVQTAVESLPVWKDRMAK